MFLGRLSYLVVPFSDKRNGNSCEGEHGARHEYQEHLTELAKQVEDFRSDVPEDSVEPGLSAFVGKLEGEYNSESRGRFIPSAIVPAEEGEGTVSRLDDDLDDEEGLGIVDAGDEEWTEVMDVIKEHSAVTIFNHTDSTWYVSSKHPHFVRPLHGKRRHPLRHSHLMGADAQTWTQNAERLSPLSDASSRSSARQEEASETAFGGMHPQADLDSSVFKEMQNNPHRAVVQGGRRTYNASFHVQKHSRRPQSAPSVAHGRPDVGQISASNMVFRPASSGQRPVGAGGDSHQRSLSAEQVHVSILERATDEPQPRTPIRDDAPGEVPGVHSTSGGQSLRQHRSASPPIFEDRSYED